MNTRLPEPLWAELTSADRLPGLSRAGRTMLAHLRTHPAAPNYRDFSGHRLSRLAQWLARWRHYRLRHQPIVPSTRAGQPPHWVWPWLAGQSLRSMAAWPRPEALFEGWAAIPTTSRQDLQQALHRHVPHDVQNQRLICFTTSGTTGHPIRVPSLPSVAAAYQALHERALALHGIQLSAGQGNVGVVLVGYQQRCFTYVSVNPLKGQCGLAKINLNPADWKHPGDRASYLDALRPELISGDPVSLSELAELGLQHHPRALLSTSMALSDGLRVRLSEQLGCPVLDLYSMNEVGPIGVFCPELDGFALLQPRLFVEILDERDQAVPQGELGEITVTGGFNPCLPLLRYRTGDFARLCQTPRGPVLRGLQGRPPVRFVTAHGCWINNVDITQALRGLDIQRFALHQHHDQSLSLRLASDAPDQAALKAQLVQILTTMLGPLPLSITPLRADDKVRQYTSDLTPP
jgi:phenylacetate-CoA ligase